MPLKDLEARREYMRTYGKDHPHKRTREQLDRNSVGVLKHQRERKKKINEIKLARGCCECGYKEHAIALDFHHRGMNKMFTIGNSTHGWEKTLEEIAKCDVLCANCHRVSHYGGDFDE